MCGCLSHCCFCKLCGRLFLLVMARCEIPSPNNTETPTTPDRPQTQRPGEILHKILLVWNPDEGVGKTMARVFAFGSPRFSNQFCNCFSPSLASSFGFVPQVPGSTGARLLNPKLPDTLRRPPASHCPVFIVYYAGLVCVFNLWASRFRFSVQFSSVHQSESVVL